MRTVPSDAAARMGVFLGTVGIFTSGDKLSKGERLAYASESSRGPRRGDCGSCTFNTAGLLEEGTFLPVSVHLLVFIPR